MSKKEFTKIIIMAVTFAVVGWLVSQALSRAAQKIKDNGTN